MKQLFISLTTDEMKVIELIKQLQELPEDSEIKIEIFYSYDPDAWEYSEYEEPIIEQNDNKFYVLRY